jgi:hypothetical protein
MCIDPSFLGPWVEERWPHGVIDFPLFDCTPFLVYAYDFLYKKNTKRQSASNSAQMMRRIHEQKTKHIKSMCYLNAYKFMTVMSPTDPEK